MVLGTKTIRRHNKKFYALFGGDWANDTAFPKRVTVTKIRVQPGGTAQIFIGGWNFGPPLQAALGGNFEFCLEILSPNKTSKSPKDRLCQFRVHKSLFGDSQVSK